MLRITFGCRIYRLAIVHFDHAVAPEINIGTLKRCGTAVRAMFLCCFSRNMRKETYAIMGKRQSCNAGLQCVVVALMLVIFVIVHMWIKCQMLLQPDSIPGES